MNYTYLLKPKKEELEKMFIENTYYDRSKQGFPNEETLKKQIDEHMLKDKTVWFDENKITNTWVKKDFNFDAGIKGDYSTWKNTTIPSEAMVFINREECLNWINKYDLRLIYIPTEHLFI